MVERVFYLEIFFISSNSVIKHSADDFTLEELSVEGELLKVSISF
jgi:hypothetical protein